MNLQSSIVDYIAQQKELLEKERVERERLFEQERTHFQEMRDHLRQLPLEYPNHGIYCRVFETFGVVTVGYRFRFEITLRKQVKRDDGGWTVIGGYNIYEEDAASALRDALNQFDQPESVIEYILLRTLITDPKYGV